MSYPIPVPSSCSICKKGGNDSIVWLGATTCVAHKKCFDRITQALADTFQHIHSLASNNTQGVIILIKATVAVEAHLGKISLLEYVDQHGASQLSNLFFTIGIPSAIKSNS
jgi:hypothetical protein